MTTPETMPEEIFAVDDVGLDEHGIWSPSKFEHSVKYIRADLVEARIRNAVEKERESCAELATYMTSGIGCGYEKSTQDIAKITSSAISDAIRLRRNHEPTK